MSEALLNYLGDQPLMRVLRAFISSNKPRYLREIVSLYNLSPGGVSDILRRLSKIGVLHEIRQGNRKYYELKVEGQELQLLKDFFSLCEKKSLEQRAERFSKNAAEKLKWMDESYTFFRQLPKRAK